MDLTTDLESALLNWDVDEMNNAPTTGHEGKSLNDEDGKDKNLEPSAPSEVETAAQTSHDASTSLSSLPKQNELLQQLNCHQLTYQQMYQQQHLQQQNLHNVSNLSSERRGVIPGESKRTSQTEGLSETTASDAIPYYHAILPPSSDATMTSNNATPNFYHHHVGSTNQNSTNLLLNGFVTALDNQPCTSTLQQSGYQISQQSNTSGSSSASSGRNMNTQTINTDKSSQSIQVEQQQLQQQPLTPQHLQVNGLINPFWNLQDSSCNNRSDTNVCTTNSTAPCIDGVLQPNYFQPGTALYDTNSSNTSNAKVSGVESAEKEDTIASISEYGIVTSKIDNSNSSSTSQPTILSLQSQQRNQSNVGNASVTPCGQRVPQHQVLPQRTLQMSNSNTITTTEPIFIQKTIAAQNAQNSQMGANDTPVDTQMGCGNNNVSVLHQSEYHMNNNGYGSNQLMSSVSSTTSNGMHDTISTPTGGEVGQQLQQMPPSAPLQCTTTNSQNDVNPSPSNGCNNDSRDTSTAQKRPSQDPNSQSKAKKKARTNDSQKIPKQEHIGTDSNTTPPFYLFDAPCELRTNFIKAQQLNNITVVQDNNAYHYGMAVNGFHPQLNAQANPSTTKICNGNSPINSDRVVLLDGRHKNKIRQGNERNEREQQRAQKITELIDKLRMTMVNGGWKKNEMKSKYQTLSTCAAYVKHLIQETKKKEAAIEKARSNLAIRDQKFEEDKALQDSRSDPESVASSLTTSSAFGTNDGPKGQSCDERGEKEGSNTISSSSGGGSDNNNNNNNNNNSNINSNNKNDEHSNNFPQGKKNENKGRIGTLRHNNRSRSIGSSRLVPGSCNKKDNKRRSDWQDISIHNRCSSMSEISDDAPSSKSGSGSDSGDGNTGSSSLTSSTKNGSNSSSNLTSSTKNVSLDRESGDMSEASSVSSTAAVVSGSKDSMKDQKIEHGGKEKISLDKDFELNYKEVFLASNIPQLIATPTGRIAICNDFFHRATGMSEQDIQRITIFSIVKTDGLSTLFELVATSLKRSNKSSSTEDRSTEAPGEPWSSSNYSCAYKTVTLPCIPFPKGVKCKSSKNEEEHLCPLFMAVTFMSDENPKNRCIHCILTEDGPGTGIKTITPQVLKKMFSGNGLGDLQSNRSPISKTKTNEQNKETNMVLIRTQNKAPITKTNSKDEEKVQHEILDT